MSIRIYKGFVVDTTSFFDIAGRVAEFRPWVEAQANEKLDLFMARVAPLGEVAAYDYWQGRREDVRRTNRRDPAVDTQFTLSFIPLAHKTLGVAYVEDSAWFDAWLQQPGVSYYGYWSNSDAPDEISEAEWAQRRDDWAVLGSAAVSEKSFSIELLAPQKPFPLAWRERD